MAFAFLYSQIDCVSLLAGQLIVHDNTKLIDSGGPRAPLFFFLYCLLALLFRQATLRGACPPQCCTSILTLHYAEDVRSKRILTCELVQLAVKRYYNDLRQALDKGWYFDRKAAMRAIGFIERLKHTKGEWAGQKFILEPWQHFILWNIFGWKNANGTRRFRYVYVEIARKNGKTALSAGIGLYMLFADGEARPEVYFAATVKDQAKICFSDAVEIVKATDLKNYLDTYRNSIVYEQRGGMMKPLSSDYGTHDGLNPSCGIIDEFHAHKDSGMFDVIKSAFGARKQPLMFIITTAGFNKNGA